MTESLYYTTKDCMEKIGLKSAATLMNWVARGDWPPPTFYGKPNRWDKDVIHQFLARKKRQ